MQGPGFLGIEIGGTKLQLVLADRQGAAPLTRRLTVDPQRGAAGIRDQITQALPELTAHGPLKGVGVGFGGPVAHRSHLPVASDRRLVRV